jgi:hypothetical protein
MRSSGGLKPAELNINVADSLVDIKHLDIDAENGNRENDEPMKHG